VNIYGGSLERGHQMTVSLSTTAIFSVLTGCLSNFRDEIRPVFLYRDMESLIGSPLIPKHLTLNDLE